MSDREDTLEKPIPTTPLQSPIDPDTEKSQDTEVRPVRTPPPPTEK